jgi:hypothetical protein
MMMDEVRTIQITLSAEAYRQLETRAKERGFDSAEAFAGKVVEVMASSPEVEDALSEEEEKLIEERLRALGYIE